MAHLKQSLGFWQVTVSGIGIVIGAGIYVLIGPATQEAGSAVWASFLLAAILSALTGLSYAELAGMFPSAGAEYAFARNAFNELTGFLVGWLMTAANIIAAAAVAIGFSHYLRHFVDVDLRVGAIALLLVHTLIVAAGIQRSIAISVLLVILQVGGLLLVITVGAPHVGDHDLLRDASLSGVLGGAALIFFAFIGFDEIVTLSEETRNPSRTIPLALLLSLAVSTLLYMFVAIAAVSVVGAEAIAGSDTPLTVVISHDWSDGAADIVAVIALASTTNTSLLVLIAASRLLYGMSRSGSLPPLLAVVGPRGGAPWIAGVAAGTVAIGFTLIGNITLVASVTDFAVYAIFVAVNAALITLRFTHRDTPRTFRTPGSIRGVPILPVAGTIAVLVMIVQLELDAWIIGVATTLSGAVVWIVLRPWRRHWAALSVPPQP
jgi:APA family basic amino acid/polyamine antiporter